MPDNTTVRKIRFMPITPFLRIHSDRRQRAALFLSGGGSNAERLLEELATAGQTASYEVALLVTDAPAGSRAREIGARFSIPVVANDIRAFYREQGEARVSLATVRGRELRDQWTGQLRSQIAPFGVDFGVLAGFVPLTNITGDFPCLNVHPGDLTYLRNGERYLVGLHTVPIERAILAGLNHLRSSVIIALPYTGRGEDMDNGPILGISEPVPIDLHGHGIEELRTVAAARPVQRPPGGYADALEEVAKPNQDRLKREGDWVVLPQAVRAFARGDYGRDERGELLFRVGPGWEQIETVVFGAESQPLLLKRAATRRGQPADSST